MMIDVPLELAAVGNPAAGVAHHSHAVGCSDFDSVGRTVLVEAC